MQKKYRRLIFYIFAALFLISVPFLLLYTNGYRYNIKKNKFEKTGALLVNTITKNATLHLDNAEYANKNEFRIPNLLPGEYNVKITKPGFFDWQKKLIVESQLTTFAKDIRLLENSLPINVAHDAVEKMYPSPDQSKFIYTQKYGKKNLLKLYLSDNDEIKDIISSDLAVQTIAWSPNNDKIILQTATGFQIINTSDAKIQALPLKTKVTDLKWDEKNNSVVYAKTADGIYKLNLLFGDVAKIHSVGKDTSDFFIFQSYLYLASGLGLTQIDLNNNEKIFIPFERTGYKIRSIINKKMFLTDAKEHLQIFNLPLNKLSTPELFANAINFELSGDNLLYYNNFELWTYNFVTGNKELITRISEEIKKAGWMPGENYIVFILQNQIKIIETDKRDARQVFSFPKFEEIDDFVLNKKFNLYFIGRVNKESGIYKLKI